MRSVSRLAVFALLTWSATAPAASRHSRAARSHGKPSSSATAASHSGRTAAPKEPRQGDAPPPASPSDPKSAAAPTAHEHLHDALDDEELAAATDGNDEADDDDADDALAAPLSKDQVLSTQVGELSVQRAPATRYAKMSRGQCLREVQKRGLAVRAVKPVRGVPIPVRMVGALRGVRIHSGLPKAQWTRSPFEIIDCRLALTLDDFAKLLAEHDVVELVHMSAYRPPPKRHPAEKPGKRHGAGLALDAAVFKKKDGTRLVVEQDFKRARGRAPCAKPPKGSEATRELHAIFCEARERGLFHVMLSPNFNRAHRNHFHLEVAQTPRWFYVH